MIEGRHMELTEVIRTTFAAREFTDEDVSDETLYRILDTARFAPSGGNRQGWKVVVVRDRDKRDRILEAIKPTLKRYLAQSAIGESPWNAVEASKVTAEQIDAAPDPGGFFGSMFSAPVMLMVFVDLRVVASFDQNLPRVGVTSGASIYPFVWNILLAARNEGLGGTVTTFTSGDAEPEIQALFEAPTYMAAAALIPLGRPVKQLTKLSRKPVEEFTTVETLGGEVFQEN